MLYLYVAHTYNGTQVYYSDYKACFDDDDCWGTIEVYKLDGSGRFIEEKTIERPPPRKVMESLLLGFSEGERLLFLSLPHKWNEIKEKIEEYREKRSTISGMSKVHRPSTKVKLQKLRDDLDEYIESLRLGVS